MLPRSLRRYRFKWKYLALLAVFSVGMYFFFNHDNSQIRNDELLAFRKKRYVEYKNSESKRTGPGEGGKGVNLEGEEKVLGEKLYKKEAFNIIASDKISLQRSVPDVRDARLVEKHEYKIVKNVHVSKYCVMSNICRGKITIRVNSLFPFTFLNFLHISR